MKSYFLLLRLNLRNLLAGFRGAMRKPNGKIDISRLILYPLALLGMLIVQLLRERKHEHTEHSSKQ